MPRNPQEVFNRWKSEITSASTKQKMQSGIEELAQAPGELAAENVAGYVNGVQANQDKWKSRVSEVTLDQWKSDMTGKGFANMATGANAKSTQDKLVPFLTSFLPFSSDVKKWARKLPSATTQERIAKSGIVQNVITQWTKEKPLSVQQAIAAAQAAGLIPGNLPPVG